jgi:hypothetical protein
MSVKRIQMKIKYIARPDTWFDAGTECTLDTDMSTGEVKMGLFYGTRTCVSPLSEGSWHKVGDKYEDGEVCGYDEFDVVVVND